LHGRLCDTELVYAVADNLDALFDRGIDALAGAAFRELELYVPASLGRECELRRSLAERASAYGARKTAQSLLGLGPGSRVGQLDRDGVVAGMDF